MSVKQKIKNWRTNQILAREEKKAEKEEEKLYMRSAVREAKEKRRYKELGIKAEDKANRPTFIENIRSRISPASSGKKISRRARLEKTLKGFELGGSGKKSSGGFGLELGSGKGGFDFGTPSMNFGIGGTKRKGKKKKDDWFGGFV